MAFNSKNLQYEKPVPAFLQRLRGEQANADGRHNFQMARLKKDRLKTADEDDGPTIVDESTGEVVGQDEYEKMIKGEEEVESANDGAIVPITGQSVDNEEKVQEDRKAKEPEKQQVAEVGAPRKRKAVKVVGDHVEDTKVVATEEAGKKASTAKTDSPSKSKAAKKTKKVKLSFDEADE